MSKIAKESALFLIGTIIPASVSFVSIPIFTRYFTPQEYGMNAIIDTSFGYLNTLMFGMICSIVWRYYNEYKSKNNIDLFFGIIAFLFRISALLVVVLSICVSLVFNIDPYTKGLIISKSFALLLGAYTSIYGVVLRLEGKVKKFNFIQIFNSLSNFVLIYSFTSFFGIRNIAMYISAIITYALVDVYLIWCFRNQKRLYLSYKQMIAKIRILLPYAIASLISNLMQNMLDSSDRYMISGMIDVNATGIYEKLYGISNSLMAIFSTVFMNLFTPYVHKKIYEKQSNEFLMALMPVYVGLFLPLLMYYSVFADAICELMLAKDYSDCFFTFPCISFGYFCVSIAIFPELIIKYEKPKFVTLGYILAFVINIIINLALIPKLYIFGAAIGTAVSYLFVLVFFCIVAKTRSLSYFFPRKKKVLLFYSIPITECTLYLFVFKNMFSFSSFWLVSLAGVMAASYYLPYVYYYFIRNKRFIHLFEENGIK